ncbi:PREDICTED: uncharacterized protein LOC104808897 [Tarenaya hassleriana]|uniref:uncharacterized protein LOC104808897 n=1 Tax=Tarenaya hassleriana TaxID=28532 RepID=UPI00053C0C7D|nr:PREDICTED: uncharacterized protein LOC104808897 [Tarenaya hassleriana]
MASSTPAVSMVMASLPQTRSTTATMAFLKPLPARLTRAAKVGSSGGARRLEVRAAASKMKMEKAVSGLAAAALTASMVIPEVAEAAGSDVSPSLKNFLLSIAAGGVVVTAIIGAIVGVSNFDPVKRS